MEITIIFQSKYNYLVGGNMYLPGRYTDLTCLNYKHYVHYAPIQIIKSKSWIYINFFSGFHLTRYILNTLKVF